MNLLTHLKQTILPLLVTIVLACFALLPQVQAVSPTPDGCYPNFTTAEGCDALSLLTTGAGNTGLGWRSLFSDTTGNFNTGVGGGALALNNGDSNTAVGAAALLLNTTGTQNVAVGTDALVFNANGGDNNAVGAFALFNNIDGNNNCAFGTNTLNQNIHAGNNTAIGLAALLNNDATGNGMANNNTAVGSGALLRNTDGGDNTAIGAGALLNNTTPNFNTAVGAGALGSNATGVANTAIGVAAGQAQTSGSNNVYIGNMLGVAGESNACYIASIFGQTSAGGTAVFINSAGKLGTGTSSCRFKDDIKPMDKASEGIFALAPVTFRYKKEIDPAGMSQFGLVAEDVEKVNPDLVVRDKEGKPYSVRYDQVNAMLLNEFLKEHKAFVEEQRKVQEQGATIARLEQQIEALTAGLQKVSAQIELSKSTAQTVLNNR